MRKIAGRVSGCMTSQALAIFYLNDMDHFIKEKLGISYYVRYQDDFCLFHKSKEYLRYCLEEIIKFLEIEGLRLNNKTRIYNNKNRYIFLGHTINMKKANYREKYKKIRRKKIKYEDNKISLYSYLCSLNIIK